MLENLVALCAHHHTFVHERDWTIITDGRGHFRFAPPGQPPRPTALPLDSAESAHDTGDHIDPGVLQPDWDGSNPDYSACVAALQQELDRLQAPRTA